MGANMKNFDAEIIKLVDVKNKNQKLKFLITAADWKLWWAENKMKKECAARKKEKLTKIQSRRIWRHILISTYSSLYSSEKKEIYNA